MKRLTPQGPIVFSRAAVKKGRRIMRQRANKWPSLAQVWVGYGLSPDAVTAAKWD